MGLLESGGKSGNNEEEGRMLVDEIGRLGLWEKLALVHVNESRDKFGSGRDRHANLGEGEIGEDNLKVFLSQVEVGRKPLVLEVPGFDNKGPDRENVERLKKLAGVRL
jgi:deoxyribonuclease-4